MAKTMEMLVDDYALGDAIRYIRSIVNPKRFRTIRVGWCGWKTWMAGWYIRVKVNEEERMKLLEWLTHHEYLDV